MVRPGTAAGSKRCHIRSRREQEPFFTAVPLVTVVPQDLRYQRVPYSGTLVSINELRGRHLLLLIRRKWIQMSEVDADTERVLVWSALPESIRTSTHDVAGADALTSSPLGTGLNGILKQVERLMRTRNKLPVLLAGEAELTEQLHAELPRSWRARVVDIVRAGDHEQVQTLLRYPGAVIQPYVAEALVRVNEQTDELDNDLVRCRVQLRQLDGKLILV